MESMLRELRKRFKFVVIDSPPVLPVTDAMILSTLVDGVVFVVESGATVRGAVTRARKILQNVGANVLGIVLNKVDVRHDGYYGITDTVITITAPMTKGQPRIQKWSVQPFPGN